MVSRFRILTSVATSLFAASLLFTAPAWAELSWKAFRFLDHSGGLNNGAGSTAIADNEAADLQNIVFDESGFFKRRDGFARVNSTALTGTPAFVGLSYYKQADGDQFLVAVTDDDKVYKMDYSGGEPDGTWDEITGGLTLTLGADDHVDFAIGEDTLVWCDQDTGTSAYKWTGTGNAVALGGSPNACTMVEYHTKHLWLAGNPSAPSTVQISNLDDIETYTGTDLLTLDTNDGTIVRALKRFLNNMYVLKDWSIHRVTGSERDSFETERMVDGIGTCSNNSVITQNNVMLFVSCSGDIVIYDGGISYQIISTQIQDSLDSFSPGRFDEVQATVYNEDYYVSFSGSGASQHDTIMLFDSFNQAWSKFDGINANAITSAEFGEGNFLLVFGDYAGFANKYPSGDDDAGTAIDSYYNTKWFQLPSMDRLSDLRLVRVYVDQIGNFNLTMEVRADFESAGESSTLSLAGSGSQWGTMIWGQDTWGGGNVAIKRVESDFGLKTFYQLHFETNDTNPAWTVRGFELWVTENDTI